MGGNIRVFKDNIKTTAQTVPLDRIGRSNFCSKVRSILDEINLELHCWTQSSIETGIIFNGSSQYVFNPELSDSDILGVKRSIGDVDVMIDKVYKEPLIKYLSNLDSKLFKGFVYNEKIDQIHSVFNVGVDCQIDFEFVEFKDLEPTEFARFSHSSSFIDAQYGIKAVFHKFLIGATTYTTSQNILIADYNGNLVKDDKIPKFAVFSVVDGFKIKYKPLYNKTKKEFVKVYGLQVFIKNKNPSSTNVKRFYKYLFNKKDLNNYIKFWSFIGVCELIKESFTRDKVNEIHSKFCEMLVSHKVSKNPEEDKELKYNAYKVFIDILGFEDYFKFFYKE